MITSGKPTPPENAGELGTLEVLHLPLLIRWSGVRLSHRLPIPKAGSQRPAIAYFRTQSFLDYETASTSNCLRAEFACRSHAPDWLKSARKLEFSQQLRSYA